jgi:D-tyrosyl-tRNA(Tyr) deacylase
VKALIQRVASGVLRAGGREIGRIGPGFVVLLGVGRGDGEAQALELARRTAALRVFPDGDGKMNRSLSDRAGSVLAVPQFTLYAETAKGNRPSFVRAAEPAVARPLFEAYAAALRRELGEERVVCGIFGADMQVELVNDGPVTLELTEDSLPPDPAGASGGA